jgi:PAS domain S-box-containing protein
VTHSRGARAQTFIGTTVTSGAGLCSWLKMKTKPSTSSVAAAGDELAFLSGGGEMGALMRSHDWSRSPVGHPRHWPQSLRTVVRLMLNTGHPMYVFWGPDAGCLYNDAYGESIGPERHPGSLGRPAREVWNEIWHIIGPQIEQVMSGRGATWNVDHLVPITRHGRLEDVYWTYSYSPIDDESSPGGIGGVLVVCSETTQQVVAAKELAFERDRFARLFEQSPSFMAVLRGPDHRFEIANPVCVRIVGDRPLVGKTFAEALPEAVEQGYLDLLNQVFRSGEAYIARNASYRYQAPEGGPLVERVVDFVYQPIKDADGSVSGVFIEGVDITDRAITEASLRETEARLRAALKAGRMGSWETDHSTKTRTWSKEGMLLFGLDLPDGRGHVDGPEDEYAAAIHPDDRHVVQRFRELAARQDSFAAEYRIVRPDGSVAWLAGRGAVVARDASGHPLRLVSVMADETDRRLAEERLRIERERLSLALSAGRMGAYDFNIRDGILWWSPQTFALFGVDPATFVPTPQAVTALLHPDDREPFTRLRGEALAQRRIFEHEFRVVRPDGTQIWVAHRGEAEYDGTGQAIRSFGVTMDITERKRAEDALRDGDRKKDLFIAVLAHELRNPLAPIRNAISLLRTDGSQLSWCCDVIDRQVRQMTRLLDDLLDVSRLSRGHLRVHLKRMDAAQAISQAIEIARPWIDSAGHEISVELPSSRMEVEGDLVRLAQAFSNVLINAAKYTAEKGKIDVAVKLEEGQLSVRISDNGIGIAAEHLSSIFEMFSQVGTGADRPGAGQGIGLALSKGLVELHGGTIEAMSAGPGKGSTFEIRLPRPEPRIDGNNLVASTRLPVRSSPRKILVADDARDTADSFGLLLQGRGHVVMVAYDGESALKMAEKFRPQFVLLDLGMPIIDGFEVCRRIRATPWGGGVSIVAQSGWGQERDRRQSRAAGFDHHLVKPVDLEDLFSLIEQSV